MTALLLVDIQNDFLPGGALAVKGGDQILPIATALMKLPFDKILATRDWHPEDHGSFASTHQLPEGSLIELDGSPQILWPKHCVQNTWGAEFSKDLNKDAFDAVFSKGVDPVIDSYSTFFDNEKRRSTGLEDYLRKNQIHTLYILGLATDYCVKFSVIDACHLNFNVYVVVDGCRGIDLLAGDSEQAFREMEQAGAKLIQSTEINIPGRT